MMRLAKLDRFTKGLLRQEWRAHIRRQAEERANEISNILREATVRLIEEEWGDPAKQEDMKVLQRYGHARPIGYATLRTCALGGDHHRYTETFGLKFEPPLALMMPDAYGSDVAQWSGYLTADDPAFTAGQRALELRATWQREETDRIEELEAALRNTTSLRKVLEAFPVLQKSVSLA